MSDNLAIKLRSGTQQSHTVTENIGFMKSFVKGVVDRSCFAKFLSNLYFVYSELEAALESNKHHPCVGVIYFPELNRKGNLEEDLQFYYGSDWQNEITPLTSAKNYVSRIRELSVKQPELLIGHAYTRYMGDLSGGQMLQKVVQSTLNLVGYQGTSFYNFEQIPDNKAFKDKYREALDKVPVDDTTADKIVAEANNSFQFNMQIAKELEAILIESIGEEKVKG
ncbi:heme oxygenase (biliverdin-producing) [Plectonema cf. radiosum LEGE 06105]|uniref:Heme oxygenase (Biliverdin-producing) n=1 Tax=Plectonema cf. radiosum LEGE 06105 TaxID=945769 RepID=A0A8J7F9H3_9CYAN|nr:heme oxygenase (biliverdin-producing) [Plectonema radiosum]MBE9216830.1 heme oxygenase (biliverdin-producing) [Plectonema cf. radiosum LEGE 06105]